MDRKQGIASERVDGDGYDVRRIAQRLAQGAAMGVSAYFAGLAELPFGARPFGIALLAASGRDAIFVYFGLILSAFTALDVDEAIVYFAVYSALLVLRIFSRFIVEIRDSSDLRLGARRTLHAMFREGVGLRVLASAIFGLALGTAMLFSGGLLYYDLFGLLIVTVSAPLAAFLICGFTEWRGKRMESERAKLHFALGFLTACGITVFGARGITLYGVSVSVALGLMITLFVTARYGVGYGSIGGLLLGICYSPLLSPLFVLSALSMGILGRFSVALACFTAFFASCAWAFYVEGISALLGVFGGILAACLLYSVIHRTFLAGKARVEPKAREESGVRCKVMPDSALDGIKLYEMNARASAISDGLYRISLFFDESRKEGSDDTDAEFCVENYNNAFSDDMSAPEYRALSALLSKAMKCESNEYSTDRELSARLCQALTDLKLEIYGVLIFGVRKKTIYIKGKDRELLSQSARVILDSIAPLLPFAINLEGYEVRREGERGGALLAYEREKGSASVVRRRVTARDESVCGDSVAVFKNKDDRFFAFLSDGMGSGRSACAVSEVSVGFLANMLSTGSLCDELIDLLNGFLCSRLQKNTAECTATLDLFELDLMNGSASIYKCGAAPSYIYRRGRLFKLRSESMPIGILGDVDLKKFELQLSRGDIVVMVSDGVTGESGECPWLFDLLVQNLPSRSLERTAELIIKYATAKGSGDDITVLLVRVE